MEGRPGFSLAFLSPFPLFSPLLFSPLLFSSNKKQSGKFHDDPTFPRHYDGLDGHSLFDCRFLKVVVLGKGRLGLADMLNDRPD